MRVLSIFSPVSGGGSQNVLFSFYLAVPGLTELVVDWLNFDVVAKTSSKFCTHLLYTAFILQSVYLAAPGRFDRTHQ